MSVLFILMRDKRESTHTNPTGREPMAERLPKVLATRLRSARRAAGLSQGAVASAMGDRGFSWRQTTVAKSEAADRPVTFAEVAALSQIYKRDFEYFMYAGSDLDVVLDDARKELESIIHSLSETAEILASLKSDRRLFECMSGVAASIIRYRNMGDSGPLLGDFRMLIKRYGYLCLTVTEVYEAIEVTEEQLREVDQVALRESARQEMGRYDYLVIIGGQEGEAPNLMKGVSDFLDGQEVSESVLSVLREGSGWADTATSLLVDKIVEAVDTQIKAGG